MSSTTSGLARVVTSPTSAKLDIDAITRRMIFPDRVLGMSGTIQTFFGRAILPISVSIALLTLPSISVLGWKAGLSETYTSTTRPRMSSMTGTAAASAASGTVSAADSISLVPGDVDHVDPAKDAEIPVGGLDRTVAGEVRPVAPVLAVRAAVVLAVVSVHEPFRLGSGPHFVIVSAPWAAPQSGYRR